MGISDAYTSEIKHELNYSATWEPGLHLSVGDVGIFQGHQFQLVGNLDKLGIPFSVKSSPPTKNFNYNSRGAVSIVVKLAGHAQLPGSSIGQADAGVSIKFNRENAIVFNTTDVKLNVIPDLITLGEEIKQKYRDKKWDRKYVVVTECIIAGGATIIISAGNNSQIDLTAGGNVNVPNLNLADLSLKLNATSKSSIAFEVTGGENITPLFEAWGLKKKLLGFGGIKFEYLKRLARTDTVAPPQETTGETIEFKKVDYDDPPI